ncbi:MAG: rRNA cytosine-C5-methyltransferase [Paludibacteraceae bacterium]
MPLLPAEFVATLKPLFGDEWAQFEAALNEAPITSVRWNDKTDLPVDGDRVPWCPQGHYLSERPNFTRDPWFHAGVYYVQEASSMFLQYTVNQFVASDAMVLDMCAAPGGKSTLLSQHVSHGGLLVANEFVRQRAHILSENLQKWGNPNVIVTNNAPSDFATFAGTFDAVLVDAPCSGEGMFRKDDTAVAEWSPANVQHCVERQRDILQAAWHCLKTNGILIYSTCTYNPFENEENVRWLCNRFGAELLRLPIDPAWQITETAEGYHFYPHKTRGEGLFISVLRKLDAEPSAKIHTKTQYRRLADSQFINYLNDSDLYAHLEHLGKQYAFAWSHIGLLQVCLKQLHVLHFGVALAEQKGRDFLPQPSLALSKVLNAEAFNRVEVDLETALRYLRCEAIFLPDAPKGFLLVTYRQVPLGWVKNIGNRCNNLYPAAWRIRMNLT